MLPLFYCERGARQPKGQQMTKFHAGEEVIATATAQGMFRFRKYVIIEVIERLTAFGGFVTYVLLDELDGSTFGVRNGHLLLARVEEVSA